MEIEVNQSNETTYALTPAGEKTVIRHILECWDKGLAARRPYEKDWADCEQAYRCEVDPVKDKRLEWRSNLCLPWAFNAVESWHAYVHGLLLPKDDDLLALEGRTPDDAEANRLMTQYMHYVFRNTGLMERFSAFLKTYAIKGAAVLKVYWRTDTRRVKDVFFGQHRDEVVYHNVWFDWVDMADFVFYPVLGDIEKTTRIHRTFRPVEDLKAAHDAQEVEYMNLSQIPASAVSAEGLVLKEAWIPRICVEGVVYKNIVATVALPEGQSHHEAVLVRFGPNPMEQGRSPFVYDCMQPIGNHLLGCGLVSKSMPLLKYANFLANARADSLKRGLYPMFKYVDDGVFNPYNVVARPHAMIKVGDLSNLVPIMDGLDRLQFAQAELMQLKAEYEETTVPRLVRGQIEASNPTATETNYAQANASGKMHVVAQRINERVLKPLFELAYQLIQERAQWDHRVLEDIARVTLPKNHSAEAALGISGPTVETAALSLPSFSPLPMVDVRLVGYQHSARRLEQLEALAVSLGQLAKTPAGMFIQWDKVAEKVLRLQGVPVEDVLMSEKERMQMLQNQANEAQEARMKAEQAQKALMMQEHIKQTAEVEKTRHVFQLDWHRLQLEKEKMALDFVQNLPEGELQALLDGDLQNGQMLASDWLGLDQVVPDFPIPDFPAQHRPPLPMDAAYLPVAEPSMVIGAMDLSALADPSDLNPAVNQEDVLAGSELAGLEMAPPENPGSEAI